MKKTFILYFLFSLFGTSYSYSSECNYKLTEIHAHLENGTRKFLRDPSFLKWLKSQNFMLVSGFLNEEIHDDMVPLERALKELDASVKIKLVHPDSKNSVEKNSRLLRKQVESYSESSKKPTFLIGWSKGASESIGMLLQYPELLSNGAVSGVLSIQGAIQGSPWPDYYKSFRDNPNFHNNLLKNMFESQSEFDYKYRNGLFSLRTEEILDFYLPYRKKLDENQKSRIKNNLFFVKTEKNTSKLTPTNQGSVRLLLDQTTKHHDGILPTENQSDENLGTTVGTLYDTGHYDLMTRKHANFTNISVRDQRNRLQAIIYKSYCEQQHRNLASQLENLKSVNQKECANCN